MPRTPSNIYVYLPKDTKVYESQYYKNYVEVLRFLGIDAQEIENINLLPNNSLLLLPWLTSKLPAEESLIASVAKKKKIIVNGLDLLDYISIYLESGAIILFCNWFDNIKDKEKDKGMKDTILEWLNDNELVELIDFPITTQNEKVFIFIRNTIE